MESVKKLIEQKVELEKQILALKKEIEKRTELTPEQDEYRKYLNAFYEERLSGGTKRSERIQRPLTFKEFLKRS